MRFHESDQDTIAAIATAPGEGGIGIVRFSGSKALVIADRIFRSQSGRKVADQKGFTAQYGCVFSGINPQGALKVVDEAILLVMRSPKSYTTEDMVEIQVHGGMAVLQEVLALAVHEGARLAGPGEFTQRAFLKGRMDLIQAEAVLDLIQAKTEKSRRWASSQLEGSLSQRVSRMKTQFLQILSRLEASIDFPEDGLEIGDNLVPEKTLSGIESELRDLLQGSETGILVKRGIRVTLWGRPNAGKSSLMNCLVKQNRVIVTPLPGTTRDVVEEEIQIEGFPVRLCDTAGIQENGNLIEKEGIERSRKAAMGAELVLFVLDASLPFAPEDEKLYHEIKEKPKILILNKSDLPQKIVVSDLQAWRAVVAAVETSCRTQEGITTLEKEIGRWIGGARAGSEDESVISSVRQRDILEKILSAVQNAKGASQSCLSPELIAVDIRLAMDHLGELVGEIVTDDVLELLFQQFCIGK